MNALNRIYALVERQWVLIAGSWPRLVDLFYWPLVQITIWGLIQLHVFTEVDSPGMVVLAAVLGAVLLWDVTWRSQLGLSLAYMEEIWSRNLGNLLVSPLSPQELIVSLMTVSVMKTTLAMIPAVVVAAVFFGFNIFTVGLALPLFVLNLVAFGWSISLVAAGLVTRYGQGAQDMPWALMFGITPFCAVYYPVSVLPDLLEPVARPAARPYLRRPARLGERGIAGHGPPRLGVRAEHPLARRRDVDLCRASASLAQSRRPDPDRRIV